MNKVLITTIIFLIFSCSCSKNRQTKNYIYLNPKDNIKAVLDSFIKDNKVLPNTQINFFTIIRNSNLQISRIYGVESTKDGLTKPIMKIKYKGVTFNILSGIETFFSLESHTDSNRQLPINGTIRHEYKISEYSLKNKGAASDSSYISITKY